MAANDLTAELDRIAAELRTFGASNEDAACLLAALRAVLELAGEFERNVCDCGGSSCAPRGAVLTFCAANLRGAITREITGKGETGA